MLVKNPLITNQGISNNPEITSQGIGKIRNQLNEKGFIRSQELDLDYGKLGINILTMYCQ